MPHIASHRRLFGADFVISIVVADKKKWQYDGSMDIASLVVEMSQHEKLVIAQSLTSLIMKGTMKNYV